MVWSEKQMQILLAAEALFASKGYEGTSVRDIAHRADVNVAMISYYFGSKDKLLLGLIQLRMERSETLLSDLSQNWEMDPWEKIDRIIDYYVDKMLDNRQFHTIVSRQMSLDQDPVFRDTLIKSKMKNTAVIAGIIAEGQRKKVFRKVNVPLTISTIQGTISQVSMSKPFYCNLLKLDPEDDTAYFKKIRSKLKNHLKSLLHAYLSTGEEK